MYRADFITSIVLVALGLGAAVESWRMPRLEHLGVSPYSAPGVVPFLLGTVIAGLGLVLLARAVAAGGYRLRGGGAADTAGPWARLRLPAALFLTLGYALGLVGRLPFWAATAIFVGAFVLIFDWTAGQRPAALAWRGLLAAGFGVIVGVAVSTLFQHVFLIRLP